MYIYRLSLKFDKMENEEMTREAKIASVQRVDEALELVEKATNKQKEEYYESVIDYWIEQKEGQKRIQNIQSAKELNNCYQKGIDKDISE